MAGPDLSVIPERSAEDDGDEEHEDARRWLTLCVLITTIVLISIDTPRHPPVRPAGATTTKG